MRSFSARGGLYDWGQSPQDLQQQQQELQAAAAAAEAKRRGAESTAA